jgi:hypothetical protein
MVPSVPTPSTACQAGDGRALRPATTAPHTATLCDRFPPAEECINVVRLDQAVHKPNRRAPWTSTPGWGWRRKEFPRVTRTFKLAVRFEDEI